MDFPNSIANAISLLHRDYENGSMTIAKKAIDIFFLALASMEYLDNFQVQALAQAIKNAKPTMSALENTIDLAQNLYIKNKECLSINQIHKSVIQELEQQTEHCINTSIQKLKSIKSEPLSIITCSYSSTFLALAQKLNRLSLIKEIIALESIWNNYNYSQNTIETLQKNNISTKLCKLNQLSSIFQLTDCAIIGADRLLEDGSIVNGKPSLYLATAISGFAPLFVIAEKIKFSNKIIVEQGFEIVPKNLIKEIFT
jgi:translation initiation factor 2B subunit (eIF-2B alpha/beta/delta family)